LNKRFKAESLEAESSKRERKEELSMKFAYENLEVWDKSVDFAVDVIDTVDEISTGRKHYRLLEQIEASSTSVAMNIAEGKGRFSKKEFVQYLYIARGSLYETMTLLEVFRRKRWITDDQYSQLEVSGKEIASMIKGLINSVSVQP
jgi:four helix bundle protein